MATTILLKKSPTSGDVPIKDTDLTTGEIAINLPDRKMYFSNGVTVERLDGAYISADAPSNPTEGDLWYDTTNNLLKTHNGTSWAASGYTYTGGDAINISGTTIHHADTSTQASVNNSGTAVIQDVTLDTYGHVTGLTSKTLSLSDFSHSLANHDDVTITSIASDDIIRWDGSAWVNASLSEAGIQPAGSYLTDITGENLNDLSDVSLLTPSDNDLLAYDSGSSSWINQTKSQAGFATVASTGSYSDLSGAPTIGNGELTINAGTGISGTNVSFTANQTTNSSITLGLSLGELTAFTDPASNDSIAVYDTTAGQTKRVTFSNIDLSLFDNTTSGFITGYTETDTLDSVTDRGATTTNGVTVGSLTVSNGATVGTNLTVNGNLTVSGTTTTVSSNEVNIGDAIILLNSDETGTPSQDAGFEVERGTSANVSFTWNETDDYWSFGGEEIGNVIIDGGSY